MSDKKNIHHAPMPSVPRDPLEQRCREIREQVTLNPPDLVDARVKTAPLPESSKDEALKTLIENHGRAMNALRDLVQCTERVVRGTNPDWDPIFEEVDRVLGRTEHNVATGAQGVEDDIERRVKVLLLEESVLHQRQDTLLDLVHEYPADDSFKAMLLKIVNEDRTRPSPDYRMLLVKTHDALAKINDFTPETFDSVVVEGAFKEALRLTDVNRLPVAGFGATDPAHHAALTMVRELTIESVYFQERVDEIVALHRDLDRSMEPGDRKYVADALSPITRWLENMEQCMEVLREHLATQTTR